jgi:hypothetical protein
VLIISGFVVSGLVERQNTMTTGAGTEVAYLMADRKQRDRKGPEQDTPKHLLPMACFLQLVQTQGMDSETRGDSGNLVTLQEWVPGEQTHPKRCKSAVHKSLPWFLIG